MGRGSSLDHISPSVAYCALSRDCCAGAVYLKKNPTGLDVLPSFSGVVSSRDESEPSLCPSHSDPILPSTICLSAIWIAIGALQLVGADIIDAGVKHLAWR